MSLRLLLPLSLLLACTDKDDLDDDTAAPTDDTGSVDEDDTGSEDCEVTVKEFDYDDQSGWVAEDNSCDGPEQSPIDFVLEDVEEDTLPPLVFNYTETPLHLMNNGHSIEYEVDPEDNSLSVDGTAWPLVQFHFHAPSEHTVDGEHAPMEMHLVHAMGGNYVVVGVFIIPGEQDLQWLTDARWDEMPTMPGECVEDEVTVLDLDDLMSNQLDGDASAFLTYGGSLTTPPCTETVSWYVVASGLLPFGQDQIDLFTGLYPDNNRDVQELNGRPVLTNATF